MSAKPIETLSHDRQWSKNRIRPRPSEDLAEPRAFESGVPTSVITGSTWNALRIQAKH